MYIIFGIIGLLIISAAVWMKSERRQDQWFIVGGAALLCYSWSRHDPVFIVLQLVFIASSFVELIRMRGKR